MAQKKLTSEQISSLCLELSLLLHAGVSVADGLDLLSQQAGGPSQRDLFHALSQQVDAGSSLSSALRESGRFPGYVPGLIEVGERAGRLEEALKSLSGYYDDRVRLDRRVKNALLYPSVLLLLMLVVIVVLLSQVLPVFNDVYASLGGRLIGLAGGLLTLGRGLDAAMPVLCVLLAVLVAFLAVFALGGSVRESLLAWWRRHHGDKGLTRQMSNARFAQALAMGLRSGLPLEQAIALAGDLQGDVPAAKARCSACLAKLSGGSDLAQALGDAGMLPPSACRLLALGQRSGTGDAVMEEVARRLTEESEFALEETVGRVEPALVLCTSLLVGVILLSVMLPLMHIMTAIG